MDKSHQGRWLLLAYGATTLVSAFLLFQVQPLISKAILPWFGGSPAVWTTCVLFFQTVLFGGYVYAHLSERMISPRYRLPVHAALLLTACLFLPILPSADWKPSSANDPSLLILTLLGATVGLPYFALSSTGPLVQAWFSRAFPGRSPYRLYSLSNAGSLGALLTYPFVFEPQLTLQSQALLWSAGFVLFALLCVFCGKFAAGLQPAIETKQRPNEADGRLYAGRLLLWVALPAFASLALLATTNFVCQDIAVVPFLWVLPLSLYLLSFIICFDHQRWYSRPLCSICTLVFALLAAGVQGLPLELHFTYDIAIYLAMMFGICMICHGELVRLRPQPNRLTTFYLSLSAGGALGGLFVSLIAPTIFDTLLEWKVTIACAYLLAVGTAIIEAYDVLRKYSMVLGGVSMAAVFGLGFTLNWQEPDAESRIAQDRNFYGTIAVLESNAGDPESHLRTLVHGSIIHGSQNMGVNRRSLAETYYPPEGGAGQTIVHYAQRGAMRVGVIGLGAGTLGTYARPGDYFRFYEINRDVVRFARKYFTYLKDCQGKYDIVLGDARLSLDREEPQNFDVLVLDAFSGDAIPVHLLSREAMQVYHRHLAPSGTICVHITNTYLDLAPIVRDLAQQHGYKLARVETAADDLQLKYSTDWMLLTKNAELLGSLTGVSTPQHGEAERTVVWTDHNSNLFEILK